MELLHQLGVIEISYLRNRERLQQGDVFQEFMAKLLEHEKVKPLLSDKHLNTACVSQMARPGPTVVGGTIFAQATWDAKIRRAFLRWQRAVKNKPKKQGREAWTFLRAALAAHQSKYLTQRVEHDADAA
jgi:hypothetical protein